MRELPLKELKRQTEENKCLKIKIEELHGQKEALLDKLKKLERKKRAEQADVDRLEGRSLTAFFYQFVGKKEEKLDKERQEAYAAALKYAAAERELDSIEQDLAALENRAEQLQGCEQQYQDALAEKLCQLKTSGSPVAQQLLEIEARIEEWETYRRELKEARTAGKKVRRTIDDILKHLDDADGYAVWDLMGGGMLVDMCKHSELDEAQEKVEQLQLELRHFKTELADVRIDADLQVTVDGFLKFADFFFDGLFADWAVMEHIETAQQQVKNTQKQVERILAVLKQMQQQNEETLRTEMATREALVLQCEADTTLV